MQALVNAMKQQGVIADGERVTKTHILSAPLDLRQKAFSNLSYHLGKHFPAKVPQYKLCDPELSAEWLAEFICDPGSGGGDASIAHVVKRETVTEHQTMKVWITKEQLSCPSFMNSTSHAELMVDSGNMPSRRSKYKALADAGILEHAHEVDIELCKKLLTEGIISKAQCEIDPTDQEQVNEHLKHFASNGPSASSGAAPAAQPKKKLRTVAQPTEIDPIKQAEIGKKKAAEKKFNQARSERTTLSSKMTTQMPSEAAPSRNRCLF